MNVYNPAEDSYLLASEVERYASGKVLDMGTGSGIQAETAMKCKKVKSVTAADVNKECAKKLSTKIKFVHSDLFSSIKGKFDTIIFNPPYLPQDKGIEDAALYGGKKGYEVTECFLNSCSSHLADDGVILLLFSNLTKKKKVNEIIENNCFEKEELSSKELPFFEVLYVYMIKKSRLLIKLEKQGISGVKRFSEGNRGVIYTGAFKKKKAAVKVKNANSAATGTIDNEAKWLKVLNKRGIGPKLVSSSNDYFVYEFVEGEFVMDYLSSCSRKKAVSVIKSILQQCKKLDELKVNKEELLRPYKHVIIKKGNPVMIDFERCRKTKKPKNVTQFCQFLIGGNVKLALEKKGICISREKLLAAAKNYKNLQTSKNFAKINDEIQ